LGQQRPSPTLGQHCEWPEGQQPQSVHTSYGLPDSGSVAALQHSEYSPALDWPWPAAQNTAFPRHRFEGFYFRFFRRFAL
jgi:hypothetical protein